MANALVLLATGFEEMEAVITIDVLRRAGVDVTSASLGDAVVLGAHAMTIHADLTLNALGSTVYDIVVLPGGQPGSNHLCDDDRVLRLVREQNVAGRFVAAICAAPIVLEAAGILRGKNATAFPGYALPSARFSEESVVIDGNVITSRGPGTAFLFALTLVEQLVGPAVAAKLRGSMLVA